MMPIWFNSNSNVFYGTYWPVGVFFCYCLLRLCFIHALTDQVQVYTQAQHNAVTSFAMCVKIFWYINCQVQLSLHAHHACRSTVGHTFINELNHIWSAGTAGFSGTCPNSYSTFDLRFPFRVLTQSKLRLGCMYKRRKVLFGEQLI